MDIEQLYRDYFSVVYRYILSLSRDPLVAEEITQETFFKAMQKIDSFRGDCGIRVWLCQIAKHAWLDHCREQARHDRLPEEGGELAAAPEGALTSARAPSPEEAFLQKNAVRAAHRILHHLKEPYKEVFSLRTFGELSFADIAELFEKSESWARVTYHRARLMIREEMEDEGHQL